MARKQRRVQLRLGITANADDARPSARLGPVPGLKTGVNRYCNSVRVMYRAGVRDSIPEDSHPATALLNYEKPNVPV